MRFSRLFVFSLVFTGSALSAQAQYTSRSAAPTETAPKTGTNAAAPAPAAKTNPYTGTRTAAPAPTAKTNPYTGTSAATAAPAAKKNPYTGTGAAAAAPDTKQQQQQPAQAVFRPRPQQPAAMPQTAEDDELPSFDALEKPAAAAQGSNLPPPPPPPPPKGEIWIYMADASYENPTGYKMSCDWKIVLQNRTDTTIKKLDITYTLLNVNYPLSFMGIAPNSSYVWDQAMYSEKCPAMVQSKPKINVISCKLGTVTNQDCSKYIVVK